jgi:TPR repeat protein
MNKKIKCLAGLLVLLSIFFLQSCATNTAQMDARYQRGKESFAARDYQNAFAELKPVAAAGNRDAQYAIGYMYFYGKGVVEDRAQAQYWMQKAADQGQPLAVKALDLIAKHGQDQG